MNKTNDQLTSAKQPSDLPVDFTELKDLAIYLEGMYKGQGNILPLGRVHIENLWRAVNYFRNER